MRDKTIENRAAIEFAPGGFQTGFAEGATLRFVSGQLANRPG
jgi:hypothetical protein